MLNPEHISGSSNYEMYNTMGKLVDQKCEKHGGMRLLKLCLGDEAKSMPDDWEKFRKKCLTVFCNHFHMEYTPDLAVDAATSSRVVVYKNEAEARKMCKVGSDLGVRCILSSETQNTALSIAAAVGN